jgi:MFS family permease
LHSLRGFSVRNAIISLVIIVNTLSWYYITFDVLRGMMDKARLTSSEVLGVWTINFTSAAVFALIGARITSKMQRRDRFLLFWLLGGTISSMVPLMFPATNGFGLGIVAFVLGASFSVGLPAAMAQFSDSTTMDNRARIGGLTFLTFGIVVFAMGMLIDVTQTASALVILTVWRASGLIAFMFAKRSKKVSMKLETHVSFKSILKTRIFILYFIPWAMFCLVNQTMAPVLNDFFGEGFAGLFALIEFTLSGVCAFVSGFFCDRIGRKRIAVYGFIMLGVGYAVLGLLPRNMLSWYFYTFADGIAWGVFYTVFYFAIWGDLAHDFPSDKYYALGGLPYLLSSYVRFTLGQYIVGAVSMYAVFSLASFFLFLAVLPLMYAPETLSEKKIKDLEIRSYIEKAEKIKQKY